MVAQAARGMCLAAALVSALAGCSPIEAYRSARGLDKSDPDPATAPFSKNLAAGEVADYPNLSTVPPPPTTASTTAERTALTQKLVAERTTAEADLGTLPAAPTQAPVAGSPAKVAAGAPAASIALGAAVAPALASAAPTTVASAVVPPETAVPDTTAQPTASVRQRQPKEAPPQESSLQMPEIPTVPEAEATRPPPPAPRLGPAPSVGPVQTPATTAAVAVPVPAPPPPLIPAATEIGRAQPAASVAAFDLADPPRLAADQRARLGQVAEAYRNKPGTVKIVAYAAPAPAGAQQLASFRAALDRAQFVAAALAEAGIPSNKIQTEASPAGAGASAGRVEVRLAP